MSEPCTTVVILSWNSAETLEQCLRSVLTEPVDQVLVLDNGSTDASLSVARGLPGVELVESPVNLGFAGGQVAVLPYCRGELLLLLNADAVLLPGAVAALRAHFADPAVGAVGAAALPWSEQEGECPVDRLFVNPWTAETAQRGGLTGPAEVNSLSGAAVLVRRAALQALGGFDPAFFAYYEETDLFARMKRSGWRVVAEPRALIRHRVAASLGADSPTYAYLMTRNRWRFALRNFDQPYLGVFARRYVLGELRHVLRLGSSPVARARVRGARDAIASTPALLRQRQLTTRGHAYNARLVLEEPVSVSVVVANHNHGEHLPGAVSSVLSQSLPALEVVVVDDGSTDDSVERLQPLLSSGRVTLIEQANQGVVAARNAGAERATGEWLVFLDADDVLEPDYLAEVWSAALRHRGRRLGVVTTGVADQHGRTASVGFPPALPPRHRKARLFAYNYVHCASLVSARAFREVGGFSPEMADGYEDWDLFLAVSNAGWAIARVTRPLLRYRREETQGSRNARAQERDRELRQKLRVRHAASLAGARNRPLRLEVTARTHWARLRATVAARRVSRTSPTR